MNAMNNFTISGFVVNNAEVHNFEKSSIARFGISYRTSVKKDDQEIKLSAILNIETWIKNDDTATLNLLQKGKLIKVEGFFKADTYTKNKKYHHQEDCYHETTQKKQKDYKHSTIYVLQQLVIYTIGKRLIKSELRSYIDI